MTDDINKRMATLLALLDLKEAVARDDVQAAREIREKRLIRMLDSFSADEGEALKQAWNTSGRWTRYAESADTVLEALERAMLSTSGDHALALRGRESDLDQFDQHVDREAVCPHHRLGATLPASGEQFEGAAAVRIRAVVPV